MEPYVFWYLRINDPDKSWDFASVVIIAYYQHDFASVVIIAYYQHDWKKFKVLEAVNIAAAKYVQGSCV
jgi:hypothetical protein